MKRIILLFGVLFISASGVLAQNQQSTHSLFEGMSTRDYNRITVGYNPMKISWQDRADENFKLCPLSSSISFGYLHGSNLVKSLPLFVEYGATLHYSFGEGKEEKKYASATNYSVNKAKMYSLNIPLNVALRLGFKENKISIAPYAGLNMRYNIAGTIQKFKGAIINSGSSVGGGSYTTTYNLFDSSDDKSAMGEKALNRFQLGINAGVGFTLNRLYLGVGYVGDVMKIANTPSAKYVGNLGAVTIAVGLTF